MPSSYIKILAVDDEPYLCKLTKEFLSVPGEIDVDTAFSVHQARKALASKHYDAIISDYQMPEEDGIQFLKSLRAEGDRTPFILFTGKGREEVVIEALNNGADSYLQKGGEPVSQYAELRHRIRESVQRHRVERALRESEEQYRVIFDQSPIAIELYDPNGSLIHANPSCLRMFGVERMQDIQASSLFDDPGISEENKRQMHRGATIRYQCPVDFEKVRGLDQHPNGRRGIIWLEVLVTPLRIGQEPITGFLVQIMDNTERKRAEEALRANEQKLSLITDNMTEAVWLLDMQLRPTWMSPSVLRSSGFTTQELASTPIERQMTPRSFQKVKSAISTLMTPENLGDPTKELTFADELEYYLKDGGTQWIDTVFSMLRDEMGEPSGILGVGRDITERKRAENELRSSQHMLTKILATSPNLIYIYDLKEHRNLYANHEVVEFLGYGPQRIQEMGSGLFERILHPGDAKGVEEHQEALRHLADGEIRVAEYRMKRADGDWCWLRSRDVVFERDADGSVRSELGVAEDVTGTKRSGDALRNSEERFRIISQSSPDHILIQDRDLRYVWVLNPQLGMAEQDMIGKTDSDILAKEDADRLTSVKKEVMITGKDTRFSTSLLSLDGTTEYFDGLFHPRYDADGNVDGIIGYFRNVTETVRAQDALLTANRKLNLLTSITRHDINNQLTALIGYLSLLSEKQKDAFSEQNLRKAGSAASRITSMVEFTKTYEDLGVQAPVWQNIRALVGRCASEVHTGHVRVTNDVPAGIEVFADPLIVKVFCNLIDNSMRHGGKAATIRFSEEEVDGVRSIVCEDDGVGIPAEMKEKIFARGSGKDHGLGLFLSREILAITNITIEEVGEPGKGARFVMRTPPGRLRGTDLVGS